MESTQIANLNLLWSTLIIDELAKLGIQHICIAPGSRSTPLTIAASQSQLKKHIHFDERGLGFMALGLAKASQQPVAIITTSGTAVANLYPAIIEAWLTHVPLIVLSGDRPPELINCGANQAIMQPNIFAHYAKAINLPTPSMEIMPQLLLSTIDNAVSNQFQPIHINCMFREPLYSVQLSKQNLFDHYHSYLESIHLWIKSTQPYCQFSQAAIENLPKDGELTQFANAKGVIIAGMLKPEEAPEQLITLAKKLGWPLLIDAQSQLRQAPQVINHIDQLLLSAQDQQLLAQAEHVLLFGGRLLSKRLIDYLNRQSWTQYWQVLPLQQQLDPSHKAKKIWLTNIKAMVDLPWQKSEYANWAEVLIEKNSTIENLFIEQIDNNEFGEAQVIRYLCRYATKNIMIGNSLPVRLFDMYASILSNENINHSPHIYTNRGASGIDGLLATSCGIASEKNEATTLIIGDLSQLHDLNSLAIASHISSTLIIVIINNDGGNIFNLLPVPNDRLRDDYYRLSHGFTFKYAAEMFNLPYTQAVTIESFSDAYHNALIHQGASLIEVQVTSTQASNQIAHIAQLVKEL